VGDPLVVIVDGHREHALGLILPHYPFVEAAGHLSGRRDALQLERWRGGLFGLLLQDLLAQRHALVTDVDVIRASDEAMNLFLIPLAERTTRLCLIQHNDISPALTPSKGTVYSSSSLPAG
jgi:hypothetical protein